MLDRGSLDLYIDEAYNCLSDFPWLNYPGYAVYRHRNNRKWFAVVMDLPKTKLGLDCEGTIDVLNVKCDYYFICKYLCEEGFFPAYHMNKKHWISVALNGSVEDETIKFLLDMSFEATKIKR